MNFLVTGGAGFIGSNIVEELLKRGHNVRVLDNFSTGRRTNLAPFLGGPGSSEFVVPGSKFLDGPGSRPQRGTTNYEPRTVALDVVEGDIRSPFTVMEAMSAPFGGGQAKVKVQVKSKEGSASTKRQVKAQVKVKDDQGTPFLLPTSTSTLTSTSSISTSTSASTSSCDFVLHQAALPSVPRSIKDPITTNEVCVVGTLNVLKAALACGVKRVVYASSSSVYGDSEELPKHEGMTPNPMSPYAAAKLAGELYCKVFSRLYGLEAVALRYFNVFGPRQDPTSEYAAVIPKFIAAIREGRRPTIYGDGEQSRDFTPVANVVEANLRACEISFESIVHGSKFQGSGSQSAGSETKNQKRETKNSPTASPFLLSNVAVGERYTLNFLVHEICRILGKHIEPIYEEPRPGDVKHSLAAVEVLKTRLGLRQFTTFAEGLEQLIRAEL